VLEAQAHEGVLVDAGAVADRVDDADVDEAWIPGFFRTSSIRTTRWWPLVSDSVSIVGG
jgi:hypothetical protein